MSALESAEVLERYAKFMEEAGNIVHSEWQASGSRGLRVAGSRPASEGLRYV